MKSRRITPYLWYLSNTITLLEVHLTLVDNWIAQYGVEERAQKNRPFHLLKINLPMQNWNITT